MKQPTTQLDAKTTKILDTIRGKVKQLDLSKFSPSDRLALQDVYHAITGRVISQGCEKCFLEAFKTVNNYMDFHEPKPDIEPVEPKVYNREVKLGEGTPIQKPNRIIMLGALGFVYNRGENDGKRVIIYTSHDLKASCEHDELMALDDATFDGFIKLMLSDLLKFGKTITVARFEYRFFDQQVSEATVSALMETASQYGFNLIPGEELSMPEDGQNVLVMYANGDISQNVYWESEGFDAQTEPLHVMPIAWKHIGVDFFDQQDKAADEVDAHPEDNANVEVLTEEKGNDNVPEKTFDMSKHAGTHTLAQADKISEDMKEELEPALLDKWQKEFDAGVKIDYDDLLELAKKRHGYKGNRMARQKLEDMIRGQK